MNGLPNRLKTFILFCAVATVIGATGCAHYPANLMSRRDIERNSRSETHVAVSGLSTEDF